MIVVNSRFLTQNITGVQRFAIEISKTLQNILGQQIQFVSPKNIIHFDLAKKLNAKIIGNKTGHLWEQFDLPKYLKSVGSPLLLNLANTAPIFYRNKISTIHDIAYEKFPMNFSWQFRFFYKFLIPKVVKTSKCLFTVSEFSKKEILKIYKTNDSKIYVIYNAIDEQFRPLLKEFKDEYILAVSSIHYQKNLHSLIKAFNMIKNKNLKLFLVGGTNKSFANVELLGDLEKNPNIIFKGRVDDNQLVELYSNAKCFVFPSLYEGFGLPPLEAQACGCPVICSNAASLPEVFGDSVIYCDPYSIDDIRNKMELVIENENLQTELRTKGFENVKRFGWKDSALKVIKVIEKLNDK